MEYLETKKAVKDYFNIMAKDNFSNSATKRDWNNHLKAIGQSVNEDDDYLDIYISKPKLEEGSIATQY